MCTQHKDNILEVCCSSNNSANIFIDTEQHKVLFEKSNLCTDHNRIANLNTEENYSVIILILMLLERGYSKDCIILEKSFQVGHSNSGNLDVYIKDPKTQNVYMIEVKRHKDFDNATNPNGKKFKQLFSYAQQETQTQIISYYTFDFESKTHYFKNVFVNELLKESNNVEDLIVRWNKQYNEDNIYKSNNVFNVKISPITYDNLKDIQKNDVDSLFLQFKEILRINAISDKPNAFNKIINLLLCKITDEFYDDSNFNIKDKSNNIHTITGLKFQYLEDLDTPISFMKRLQDLYVKGMEDYLGQEVSDYTDKEIIENAQNNTALLDMIDTIRLKKNNEFAFREVFNDSTFTNNYLIVRDIVKLLQGFKFKYEYKHQFLGDFFEELLNTSLKQDEGQFFTPYPLVDFIIDVLPIEQKIQNNLNKRNKNIIPATIDYACGSGHFIISYMNKIQGILDEIEVANLTRQQRTNISHYQKNPYCWATKENIVGIEKDYRLSKATKIATFLNGDGNADILSADGINRFDSVEYHNTVMFNEKNKNEIFDFVISNPPYSVRGFMNNFYKNNIATGDGTFDTLESINLASTEIENFFIERAWQLLKDNGMACLLLPQSILTSDSKYSKIRNYVLKYFKIQCMIMLSDITFLGTTTSPVILFLKKQKMNNLNYDTMIICSDKYLKITKSKKDDEVTFLGYKFSSAKNIATITIKDDSIMNKIKPILKSFLQGEQYNIGTLSPYVQVKSLHSIVLNNNQIYPKYQVSQGLTPLKNIFKIPKNRKNSKYPYVEIGGLSSSRINTSNKNLTGKVVYENDILVSSLTPTKDKIVLSNGKYIVTTAIHVLQVREEYKNKLTYLYNELKKDYVLEQMNALLDGFKISYAKIKEHNLLNNIYIHTNSYDDKIDY